MMTTTDARPGLLAYLPPLAAIYIDQHGWNQGGLVAPDGRVCLTGALRLCAPISGDGFLACAVYRNRDRDEAWNDEEGRTVDDVVDLLRTSTITDDDLADTFGPRWAEVVSIVRRAAVLTEQEMNALVAAWGDARLAAWDVARLAAWDAAWDAARGAARVAAGVAAGGAAGDAAGDAARLAAGLAARVAAWATVVRDLLGPEDYDLLVGPWVSVCGPIVAASS